MNTSKLSAFAQILNRLIDQTGVFTRSGWATFLNVSEAAISQWLHDKTLPRPETLRMIRGALYDTDGVPHETLEEFERLLQHPAEDVTPHAERMGRSVGDYLIRPLREAFLRCLSTLPPAQQEIVLQNATAACRNVPAAPRDLKALAGNEVIDIQEARALHTEFDWNSVLIKINSLYDSEEFIGVVEKHLRHGTRLFYVLDDVSELEPLHGELARRTGQLHLKWSELVRVIPDRSHSGISDEFVVFDFLEPEKHFGFIWDPGSTTGRIATSQQLESFTAAYLHTARDLEEVSKNQKKNLPKDRPIVAA